MARRGLRRTQPTPPKLPKDPRFFADPVKEPITMERGLPQDSSLGPMKQELDPNLKTGTTKGPASLPGEPDFTLR